MTMPIRATKRNAKLLSRMRGLASDNSGSALVEFAFVVVPTLALILATIQTMLLFFVTEIVESATESAGRLLLTNQVQKASNLSPLPNPCSPSSPYTTVPTQAQFRALIKCQMPSFMQSNNLQIDVKPCSLTGACTAQITPSTTIDANGNSTNTSFAPGSNQTLNVLQVMYYWPIINGPLGFTLDNTGTGKHLVIATSVFQTEP